MICSVGRRRPRSEVCATSKIGSGSVRCCARSSGRRRHGTTQARPLRQRQPGTLVDVAVFMGHSTALSGHLVSPINPRAIILGNSTVMTFQRGVQQVELATFARDRSALNFFLLTFKQACNERPEGCRPGDLYTPRIESDWTSVEIRDDEELKNTPLDCRQCHQRARETPMLLMRELQSPWTHFFETDPIDGPALRLPGVRGSDLVEDYLRAKGDETYGGIDNAILRQTVGAILQNLVPRNQPLEFHAPKIEDERWPFRAEDGTYPATPSPSPTWEAGYEAFKRGEQLALPYFEPRPTDPQKQARLTEAYQQYRAGTTQCRRPARPVRHLSRRSHGARGDRSADRARRDAGRAADSGLRQLSQRRARSDHLARALQHRTRAHRPRGARRRHRAPRAASRPAA